MLKSSTDIDTAALSWDLRHEFDAMECNFHRGGRARSSQYILFSLLTTKIDYIECAIWVMFMGGIFATGELRSWYRQEVKFYGGVTQDSWANIRSVLEKYLWNPEVCEELCLQFYMATGALK